MFQKLKNKQKQSYNWEVSAYRRRIIFCILILLPSLIASSYMAEVLPQKGTTFLEIVLIIFFFLLITWISVGFWTAMSGFYLHLKRYDRYHLNEDPHVEINNDCRTAILFPICNENVMRVFAGVYSVFMSLNKNQYSEQFDFFLLSDTRDPDRWIEEEAAWKELVTKVNGNGRIFYRNRRVNIKRKSGNIADFCRRWGYKYRYMIVMDADSIMSGSTLVRLASMMENNPQIGILQTAPIGLNARTLFARLQQFTTHLYGPFFSAGLHFWLLGNSNYWGHNAIIRIQPFIKHCALPKLPGDPPLGGEILSHDFVEAALMRRAGWEVWLAHDLPDSFEEMPPTLMDELKRDRRWCQGNIQHLKMLLTEGLRPAHRYLFLAGAMTYISGLLWFLFLMISTAKAVLEAFATHEYFPAEHSLFPVWPIWNPIWAITLIGFTAILLFFPKVVSFLFVALKHKKRKEFGGWLRLLAGVATEIVLSALLAPVRMMFHCKFVLFIILGKKVEWEAQQRKDKAISWKEALTFHKTVMIFAFSWGLMVFLVNPSFFWWLIPILASLLLSVPITVLTSRVTPADKMKKLGILNTPIDKNEPSELMLLNEFMEFYSQYQSLLNISKKNGFLRAVVDPHILTLHLSFLQKERHFSSNIIKRKQELCQKALSLGPDHLEDHEKREILSDPATLSELHKTVWSLPDDLNAEKWGIPPAYSSSREFNKGSVQ